MEAHRQGRDVMQAVNNNIRQALKNIYEHDFGSEAMILLKAAKISLVT